MSKRLQLLLPEDQFEALTELAEERNTTVSELVRSGVGYVLSERRARSAESRIAAVLKFSRHNGPTGDIEKILEEIEQGREP